MNVHEELYLSPRFPTKEALDQALHELEAPDATRTQWIADCPRRAEYAIVRGLAKKEEGAPLRAGRALHAALAVYYTNQDHESSMTALRETWGLGADWRLPRGHRYAHLHLGHLEVVMKNYLDRASRYDAFQPIIVHKGDLNLDDVVGAVWRVTDDGRVVLGESKIVMRFDLDGTEFLYSGMPDLPISMSGGYYILDHKSTNSYLSDYYFEQYRFSNQLRGYCVMIERLTGLNIDGALINGLYMGERASLSEFKGNKFARYGPMMFSPGQLREAIYNQYHWRLLLDTFKSRGYFPQHTSKLCAGCPFATLCASAPAIREAVIQQEYTPSDFSFLNI